MADLTQIVQFFIHRQSEEIRRLKQDGVIRETVEKYAYLSPDGKSFRNKRPTDPSVAEHWKKGKVTFERLIGHMSPKHPQWTEYRAAKHRVSLLLTARLLLKLGEGDALEPNMIAQALETGSLARHVRRGQRARGVCFAARRFLCKIRNRLERTPEKFIEVDTWIGQISRSPAPEFAPTRGDGSIETGGK